MMTENFSPQSTWPNLVLPLPHSILPPANANQKLFRLFFLLAVHLYLLTQSLANRVYVQYSTVVSKARPSRAREKVFKLQTFRRHPPKPPPFRCLCHWAPFHFTPLGALLLISQSGAVPICAALSHTNYSPVSFPTQTSAALNGYFISGLRDILPRSNSHQRVKTGKCGTAGID